PYESHADAQVDLAGQSVTLNFGNTGTVGAWFQVRTAIAAKNSGNGAGPWGYTVDPATGTLADTWKPTSGQAYDLSVYGANGFYRRVAGGLGASSASLGVQAIYSADGNVSLVVANNGAAATTVTIRDNYTGSTVQQLLNAGE